MREALQCFRRAILGYSSLLGSFRFNRGLFFDGRFSGHSGILRGGQFGFFGSFCLCSRGQARAMRASVRLDVFKVSSFISYCAEFFLSRASKDGAFGFGGHEVDYLGLRLNERTI